MGGRQDHIASKDFVLYSVPREHVIALLIMLL